MKYIMVLNSDCRKIGKQAENFKQPYNNNNDNNHIENSFDLDIHRDVGIDKPK
jgi:hypothetical protein